MKKIVSTKKTSSFCSHCGGRIVERVVIPCVHEGGKGEPSVYDGPLQHDGYHCNICGIEYYKLPPRDIMRVKAGL